MSRELDLAMTVLAYLELRKLATDVGRSSLVRSSLGCSFDEEEVEEVDALILVQSKLRENMVRLSICSDDITPVEDGLTSDDVIEDIKQQSFSAMRNGRIHEAVQLYNQAADMERQRRKRREKVGEGES